MSGNRSWFDCPLQKWGLKHIFEAGRSRTIELCSWIPAAAFGSAKWRYIDCIITCFTRVLNQMQYLLLFLMDHDIPCQILLFCETWCVTYNTIINCLPCSRNKHWHTSCNVKFTIWSYDYSPLIWSFQKHLFVKVSWQCEF